MPSGVSNAAASDDAGGKVVGNARQLALAAHLAKLDKYHEDDVGTQSIKRRVFAGDTETVSYKTDAEWQRARAYWESRLLREDDTWESISQRDRVYMHWDDGTRSQLFREKIDGKKFTYDTANLGKDATTSAGWQSKHWEDMSVADVQGSVLVSRK